MFDSALLCKWSAASQLSTPSTGVFARYEPCQRSAALRLCLLSAQQLHHKQVPATQVEVERRERRLPHPQWHNAETDGGHTQRHAHRERLQHLARYIPNLSVLARLHNLFYLFTFPPKCSQFSKFFLSFPSSSHCLTLTLTTRFDLFCIFAHYLLITHFFTIPLPRLSGTATPSCVCMWAKLAWLPFSSKHPVGEQHKLSALNPHTAELTRWSWPSSVTQNGSYRNQVRRNKQSNTLCGCWASELITNSNNNTLIGKNWGKIHLFVSPGGLLVQFEVGLN